MLQTCSASPRCLEHQVVMYLQCALRVALFFGSRHLRQRGPRRCLACCGCGHESQRVCFPACVNDWGPKAHVLECSHYRVDQHVFGARISIPNARKFHKPPPCWIRSLAWWPLASPSCLPPSTIGYVADADRLLGGKGQAVAGAS